MKQKSRERGSRETYSVDEGIGLGNAMKFTMIPLVVLF